MLAVPGGCHVTAIVQIDRQGDVRLPPELLEQYGLAEGHEMTLLDLGGTFVLSPTASRIDALCREVRTGIEETGATLDDMLRELRQHREVESA